jgi:hypothetical protein
LHILKISEEEAYAHAAPHMEKQGCGPTISP